MRVSMPGVWLLAVLVLLPNCRSSIPPAIEICLGDGVGGADCIERDNTKIYRPPSELKNYWMTNEPDEAAFASWCYNANPDQVQAVMNQKRLDLK